MSDWGINITASELDKAALEVREAAARGLREAALHVLTVSNKNAPRDTGDMIKSGKVSKVASRKLISTVSYSKYYAPFVHEDMTAKHPKGGQAKFLEQAFVTERLRVAEIVAAAIKRDV